MESTDYRSEFKEISASFLALEFLAHLMRISEVHKGRHKQEEADVIGLNCTIVGMVLNQAAYC